MLLSISEALNSEGFWTTDLIRELPDLRRSRISPSSFPAAELRPAIFFISSEGCDQFDEHEDGKGDDEELDGDLNEVAPVDTDRTKRFLYAAAPWPGQAPRS